MTTTDRSTDTFYLYQQTMRIIKNRSFISGTQYFNGFVPMPMEVLYNSNKSSNKTQQLHKFITWRLCVAQHVSGASSPIIRSLQLHSQSLVLPLERGGSSVVGRGLAGSFIFSNKFNSSSILLNSKGIVLNKAMCKRWITTCIIPVRP